MTVSELEKYFNAFLNPENFEADPSMNGLQIQNSDPESKQIKKIAFAVDACEETARRAAELNCDALFVHHGLFWGHSEKITGSVYKRISTFIKNDLALFAYHAPLDANNPYGNNYGLASRIGLQNTEVFGYWRGMPMGVKGILPVPMTINDLAEKTLRDGKKPNTILPFGKEKISTVGIISGGGSEDVETAVAEELDCFITGEFAHEQFHYAKENKINVIGGGHYETETVGVSLVMKKVADDLGIETVFIESETGL
ncbi:MAG: Nif3-like dinuclear metal center hexameric protein [Treponema sp.]|nr:Nif3-like dinuclear metal center hexameric protein [Treponema sp.]